MSGSFLLALSYILLAVFAIALVAKSIRIARMPVHLRWELAPVPKERTRGRYGGSYLEEYEWWRKPREESRVTEIAYMLKEILLLKALWEHRRSLWWFSYPFHLGLYFLIAAAGLALAGGLAAAVGIPGPGWGLTALGIPWLAGAGYVLGAVGALGLLGRRLADARLRVVTTPVAFFNLVLLAALFVTGGLSVVTVEAFPARVHELSAALVTAGPVPELPAILATHWTLALVFLAYLPFSQMMHFVAKYFTYHQVRWDDRPLEVGGAMEREVIELLSQPVGWAAAHVGADGRKSWVDVATEEVKP
jgi:nitrate reductase gamma subunit